MEYDMLLLRFGEITLKGRNRSRFEKVIHNHVKALMHDFPRAEVIKEYGRIFIAINGEPLEPMIAALKNVFGVTSMSPIKVVPSRLEDILQTAVDFIKELGPAPGTKFKVTARRIWKPFPHSSQEMNKLVSNPILNACPELRVDVHHPELELRVEIREQGTYLFCEVIPGAGGFPLGSNGKAMLLLSGGIDSPVAGWSALRRGLEIECVHFHSYPFTSKKAEQKVIDLANVLAQYSGFIKLHLVPFTEIQTKLAQTGQDNLIITMMRRAMLRIATKLAERNGALALVTGDSLGQVASQTLSSMNAIGRVTNLPILRPLVMTDKVDIIAMAQQIGTYDLSILPYEDCCTLFVPKSPATNPNLRVLENVERSLENLDEMIDKAVEDTETIFIRPGRSIKRRDNADNVVQESWF
ncbi:tRNA uracil 4-sulfurtransferase ThiI [Paenibacillus phoenicis]|uniref:Probable tRNA sulfurtransferase n=1 Tax=Paenibacillus phoenicis TaxID=554117 RepID=A0ABU5PK39_9BACL|nr:MULTISPECIES: tRNA uracil 4-sulfurtransferase ThiI [Paenibacillus]EES72457.1 thiamine biosynthesis/tRNA modification protein ThiI [Paenibacillus sp. oral taxon 786 str. D14]MEA3570275.1 tRNA uracil 4-sulfurtransferase ThiI [Paenibacillus phoenicis]